MIFRYYPVYKMIAPDIADQCNSSGLEIFVFPGPKCDLIPQMYHERVHAVALHCERYRMSFGNQLPDFLHHHGLFFYDCLHCLVKSCCYERLCKITDKKCYL